MVSAAANMAVNTTDLVGHCTAVTAITYKPSKTCVVRDKLLARHVSEFFDIFPVSSSNRRCSGFAPWLTQDLRGY